MNEQPLPEQATKFIDERVARFAKACTKCQGTGEIDHPVGDRGVTIRIGCDVCHERRYRVERFAKIFFNADNVLPRYWDSMFYKLEPNKISMLPLDRQTAVLECLKKEPDKGYAFFGPARTSKTTFSVALYAQVLWKEIMRAPQNVLLQKYLPVRRIGTKKMLDQMTEYAIHEAQWDDVDRKLNQPDVTPEKIKASHKSGFKYHLFLEEIDKVKETESRRANLFEVIDTLYGCEGQLVITSNLSPAEFAEKLGGDFMHRIGLMCEIVDFFK